MHGYHFNAVLLQDYIIEQLKNSGRVNLRNFHVDDINNLDSDYIVDCSGKPKDYTGYDIRDEIPVNAVSVTQCYWEGLRFTQTLTIARPYGWVFGIPLLNRCAIGYLYNKDINTLEEVQEDVKNVYEEFKLTPSQEGNKFYFNNYTKKENYSERIVYNGNASFFLEPLEATSLSTVIYVNRQFKRIMDGELTVSDANMGYYLELNHISFMIMLHYFAGSTFDTPFWREAKLRADTFLKNSNKFSKFSKMIEVCNSNKNKQNMFFPNLNEVGTWPGRSYLQNLEGLGIKEELYKFIK
jgi:hypothetical protein